MQNKHVLLLLSYTLAITSCTDGNGHLNEIGIGLLIGAIGGLFIVIWQSVNRYKAIRAKKQAIKDALSERTDFTESKVIKGDRENSFYLATDNTRKKVFYVFGDKTHLFDFKNVDAVQIKENGSIIVSKVSTESALLGAIIGDAVIGGKRGGLMGASAFGKITNQKQISSMYVHISLRDQRPSSIDIPCFDNRGEPLPQGLYRLSYELATIRAKELYDLFQEIIDEVDTKRREEEKRNEALREEEVKQVKDVMQNLVVAQQMMDVAGQYLTGQISDEEFNSIKENCKE